MNVLFASRSTLFSSPGGDTTQMLKTAEGLRNLGVDVVIQGENGQHDPRGFDLVHGFNINRPADLLPYCCSGMPPLVVSTIYVDFREWESFARSKWRWLSPSMAEYVKVVGRVVRNGDPLPPWRFILTGQFRSVQRVARVARVLLPNSESEYRRFARDFRMERPYRVVPNAIDPRVFDPSCDPDPRFQDAVLCVGRIEGRKNQLELIRAMRGTDIPLKIVGKPSPNHRGYFEQCRQEAGPNVEFTGQLTSAELARAYAAARVHVLPSWFETTGLTSLEAAATGCRIVVTDKGDQREYFSEFASFCDPGDGRSIRDAVLQAWHLGRSLQAREKILESYTWDVAAKLTYTAYLGVLESIGEST